MASRPDDTSVNGAIDADPCEDDGEPWDLDRGFPLEVEIDDDDIAAGARAWGGG